MRKIRSMAKFQGNNDVSQRNWRIYILLFFILFVASSIVIKLFFLQVTKADYYASLADNQHERTQEIDAQRGEIFLQDEKEYYPLAVNRELQMAFAVPREIKEPLEASRTLSEILGIDRGELDAKLNKPEDRYEVIKKKLSEDEVEKVREAKIPGIYLTPENYRYYPAGELASQVVGFLGSNGEQTRGMYGLEAFWDEDLKGERGLVKQEGDARGRWISVSDRDVQEARNGHDLILTINHTVQYEVEKILKEAVQQNAADGGTVVVMEAKTGRVLAMANAPAFNPNEYSKVEDVAVFNNPAVSMPYESGSVFKTFTVAMGIDDGKINPETTYVDTGLVSEAGYEIQNSDLKANGVQTMRQALAESLNTGMIFIEKLVGNRKFADYVERFGFGQKTGIELPGELGGNTKNLEYLNRHINFFTASFGQGITVTPIQLAAAYGAIANEGMLMKAQIIQKLRNSDGTEEEIRPQEVRQVIKSDSANAVLSMLRDVVVYGHGKRADVPGYLVGGKTGTAQIAKVGSKGYEEGINIGSFAGIAPLNDPQFVVVVKMVRPRNVEWAESSAAPTFGRVMKFLLEYYKVKPTEDPNTSPLAKMAPIVLKPIEQTNESSQSEAKDEKAEEKKKND